MRQQHFDSKGQTLEVGSVVFFPYRGASRRGRIVRWLRDGQALVVDVHTPGFQRQYACNPLGLVLDPTPPLFQNVPEVR